MKKSRPSFTLIELLLYFTILGIFLFVAVSFAIQILNVSQLSSNRHELESNGEFIVEKIRSAIHSAESVDASKSSFDSDQGVLSLIMDDSEASPTLFSYSNGELLFEEGLTTSVSLQSSFVRVNALRFHRIEFPKNPDQIIVDLALSVPSDIPNAQAELELHFTISLRP